MGFLISISIIEIYVKNPKWLHDKIQPNTPINALLCVMSVDFSYKHNTHYIMTHLGGKRLVIVMNH